MARPKQTVILRVHRNVAGVSFPWDCVYFFRRSEESLLPKIFPCSLVLVMTKRFTRLVKKAVDNPRGDKGQAQAFPQQRRDGKKLAARVSRHDPVRTVLANPKDYVALIPTLHLRGKIHDKGKSGPAYLTARPRALAAKSASKTRKWNKKAKLVYTEKGKFTSAHQMRNDILKKLMREALSSRAYFLFRGEKIQPVCLCCPNNLDYLDGKCVFGDTKCYRDLEQARAGDFEDALKIYKSLVSKAEEPEVTHEQLS